MPTADFQTFNINAEADVSAIRHETFDGVEHLIVPIIALVEGVIQASNAATPELALAEVFGLFPTGWNGRPVTLDHPEVRGMKVSASQTPDVYAKEALGFLFNTTLEDKKLKTEAWINLEKVKAAGENVQKEIARLESGDLVEVSTGLFAVVKKVDGVYASEQYNGVWEVVVPDHLAILPEGTKGACSVEDGCGGPRLNKEGACCDACAAKASTKHKKKKKGAIMKKGVTGNSMDGDEKSVLAEFLTGLRDKFQGVFKFNSGSSTISDIDIRRALTSALIVEDETAFFDIVAVFEESFVYAKGFDGTLLSRSFSVADKGPVTLGGEVTAVRPVTEFVPVNIKEGSKPMTNKEVIDALIANKATQYSEDDRQWLSELPVERLNKLSPVANGSASAEGAEDEAQDEVDAEKEKLAANAAVTPEDFIKNAPAEMQDVLQEGLRMHRAEKDKIVKELVANKRCSFTEKELKAMEVAQLRKLAALGNLPSYEGQGGGNAIVKANSNKDAIPAAPLAFVPKTAAK
jgi:hypothetical protein